MNIHSPLSATLKLVAITSLTALFVSTAFAGESANHAVPQFSVSTNVSGTIGAAATAFERGNFNKSASFSRHALKQGLKKSKKATAYSNLCAALGVQGDYVAAIEACSSALKIAPTHWQAYSNRAAAHWLSGNKQAARTDMEAAQKLASDIPEIIYNKSVFG